MNITEITHFAHKVWNPNAIVEVEATSPEAVTFNVRRTDECGATEWQEKSLTREQMIETVRIWGTDDWSPGLHGE